jgi:hypothetical protein
MISAVSIVPTLPINGSVAIQRWDARNARAPVPMLSPQALFDADMKSWSDTVAENHVVSAVLFWLEKSFDRGSLFQCTVPAFIYYESIQSIASRLKRPINIQDCDDTIDMIRIMIRNKRFTIDVIHTFLSGLQAQGRDSSSDEEVISAFTIFSVLSDTMLHGENPGDDEDEDEDEE